MANDVTRALRCSAGPGPGPGRGLDRRVRQSDSLHVLSNRLSSLSLPTRTLDESQPVYIPDCRIASTRTFSSKKLKNQLPSGDFVGSVPNSCSTNWCTRTRARTPRRCDYRIAVWNEISLTGCSALPDKCRVCQVRIWWTLYCSCNYLILDGFQNQSCSHYYFFVDILILFSLRIRNSVLLVFQCDSSTRATWIKFR